MSYEVDPTSRYIASASEKVQPRIPTQHSSNGQPNTLNYNSSKNQNYPAPPPYQLQSLSKNGSAHSSAPAHMAPYPSGQQQHAGQSPVTSSSRLHGPASSGSQHVSSRNFQEQAEPNIVFRIGKFIPCIFIAAVIGWSYYAVVIHILLYFYRQVVENTALFIYLIIQYHIILVLFIWSWLKTVLTKPATVGNKYRLTQGEVETVHACRTIPQRNQYFDSVVASRSLVVVQRLDKSHPADFRYCKKSHALKPDRAHYDSMTKRLVLKMDHYCPWVANCIGYSNYKFFVLFLFYAILYCWMIIAITIKPFLQVWSNTGAEKNTDAVSSEPSGYRMQCILVFLVSGVFSLSILFLFGFHCYLISKNRTTIECYGAPVIRNVGECKHAYDVGCMPNWRQVMGRSPLCWLLPIDYDDPKLDGGHSFPLSPILATNQAIEEV